MTQDFECFNIPGTLGLGVSGLSGAGGRISRPRTGRSFVNDITTELLILGVNLDAGVQLTDNLSVGAAFTIAPGFEQLGFVGPLVATSMVNAYGIRGTLGLDYAWNDCTDIGFYYMSPLDFQFPDGLRIGTTYHDIRITQPTTFGWGVANHALMDGRLLVAADVYYKLWEDADLYRDVFVNQWAFAIGSQLTNGRYKYRLGYSYNENPLNHSVGSNLDGVPIGQSAVQLFQAASVRHDQSAPPHGGYRHRRLPLPECRSRHVRRRHVRCPRHLRQQPRARCDLVHGPRLHMAIRRLLPKPGGGLQVKFAFSPRRDGFGGRFRRR